MVYFEHGKRLWITPHRPVFTDAEQAREWLEKHRWPNGPVCPHCGNSDPDKITSMQGEKHRRGLYQCNECREQFTVQVGAVMERSHIKLQFVACRDVPNGERQERHIRRIR